MKKRHVRREKINLHDQTPGGLVRKIFPGVDDDMVDRLLWCCTAWPCTGKPSFLIKQLREAKKKGGGTPEGAIKWTHDDLDEQMERRRKELSK